jgi:hypothetical protein
VGELQERYERLVEVPIDLGHGPHEAAAEHEVFMHRLVELRIDPSNSSTLPPSTPGHRP